MIVDFNNPATYESRRSSERKRPCDGFCISCPERRECPFSKVGEQRNSQHNDSDELDLRTLSMYSFKTRFGKGPRDNYGFSNPNRDYPTNLRGDYSCSLSNYNSGISSGSGFHGSYSGKDDYSQLSPCGSKSNYCSGAGFGKK
jgi:hypothetical protein